MIAINLTEKGGQQRRLEFTKDEVTIGRVQGNDVVLGKGNVSKRHARLVLKDGKLVVVDLKSTNGTYVNGRKISSPLVIGEADKVYIGDFIIMAEMSSAPDRPASASAPPPVPPGGASGSQAPAPPSAESIPPGPPPAMPDATGTGTNPASIPPYDAATSDNEPVGSGQHAAPANVSIPDAPPPRSAGVIPSGPPAPVSPGSDAAPPMPSFGSQPSPSSPLSEPLAPPPPQPESAAAAKQGSHTMAGPGVARQPAGTALGISSPPSQDNRDQGVAMAPTVLPDSPVDNSPGTTNGATKQRRLSTSAPSRSEQERRALLAELGHFLAIELGTANIPYGKATLDALKDRATQSAKHMASNFQSRLPAGTDLQTMVSQAVMEVIGLGPVEQYMKDPVVDEIYVDAFDRIWLKRNGVVEPGNKVFSSAASLARSLTRVHTHNGASTAILESGFALSLCHGLMGPAARLVRQKSHDLAKLVSRNTVSQSVSDFLTQVSALRGNVLIAGPLADGVTILTSALANELPTHHSVLSAARPLTLTLEHPRWMPVEDDANVLALEPDHLIVDTTSRALCYLPSWNNGQSGVICMATAADAEEALQQAAGRGELAPASRAFRTVVLLNRNNKVESIVEYDAQGNSKAIFSRHNGTLMESSPSSAIDALS